MKKNISTELDRLEQLLNLYLIKAGLNNNKTLFPDSDGEKLFKIIVQDYVTGTISVDDLSTLCELFYSKLDRQSDLYSLLLMGAEVEWYIRHKPQKAANTIEDLIKTFSKESLETD